MSFNTQQDDSFISNSNKTDNQIDNQVDNYNTTQRQFTFTHNEKSASDMNEISNPFLNNNSNNISNPFTKSTVLQNPFKRDSIKDSQSEVILNNPFALTNKITSNNSISYSTYNPFLPKNEEKKQSENIEKDKVRSNPFAIMKSNNINTNSSDINTRNAQINYSNVKKQITDLCKNSKKSKDKLSLLKIKNLNSKEEQKDFPSSILNSNIKTKIFSIFNSSMLKYQDLLAKEIKEKINNIDNIETTKDRVNEDSENTNNLNTTKDNENDNRDKNNKLINSYIYQYNNLKYTDTKSVNDKKSNILDSQISIQSNPILKTTFYFGETLEYQESEILEYKDLRYPFNYNQNGILEKTICGFLNRHGGFLFIGITDSNFVRGVLLQNKDIDNCRNHILNLTTKFYPKVKRDLILVDVFDMFNLINKQKISNLYIIKVTVKQGNPRKLYSVDDLHCYKSFIRIQAQTSMLTPLDIEEEIIKRKMVNEDEEKKYLERVNDSNNRIRVIDSNLLINNTKKAIFERLKEEYSSDESDSDAYISDSDSSFDDYEPDDDDHYDNNYSWGKKGKTIMKKKKNKIKPVLNEDEYKNKQWDKFKEVVKTINSEKNVNKIRNCEDIIDLLCIKNNIPRKFENYKNNYHNTYMPNNNNNNNNKRYYSKSKSYFNKNNNNYNQY